MARAAVEAGVCGFATVITAQPDGMQNELPANLPAPASIEIEKL